MTSVSSVTSYVSQDCKASKTLMYEKSCLKSKSSRFVLISWINTFSYEYIKKANFP